jgi:hypothetical protein
MTPLDWNKLSRQEREKLLIEAGMNRDDARCSAKLNYQWLDINVLKKIGDKEVKEHPCTLMPVVQDNQEIITCAYNPITKVWKCWSIAEVPWGRRKFEMLEVCGRKFSNEFELIGFKPETGNTVGVQFSMNVLLKQMIEMLQSHLAER